MRCKDVRVRLAEFAGEALSAREQAAFGGHLSGCPECRAELESLDHSLRALEAAAPNRAPDLWSKFQRRLSAESAECAGVRLLLPARAAQELSVAEDGRVLAHLAHCEACVAEEAGFVRSFGALGAAPAEAPDLWPSFSLRLAAETACADVSALLPEYLAGEMGGLRGRPVAGHLETCSTCAREAAAYARTDIALDAASHVTAPDLWPAFAARLEAEEQRALARPWVRWPAAAAAVWASLWAQPTARPVFAAGLAAAALWLALPRLQQPTTPEPPALQARVTAPEKIMEPVVPPAPAVVKLAPPVRLPAVPRVRFARAERRRSPKAVAPRRVKPAPEVLARAALPAPVRTDEKRWPGLQVAFNPDLATPAAAPVAPWEPASRSMSGDMEQAVKRDFVELAGVIEDIRDVARSPLEAGSDAE